MRRETTKLRTATGTAAGAPVFEVLTMGYWLYCTAKSHFQLLGNPATRPLILAKRFLREYHGDIIGLDSDPNSGRIILECSRDLGIGRWQIYR
jgi:hypothetical protein